MQILHFRFDCDRFTDEGQWCALVDAMWDELDAGRSVLVHCMAGVHRAPMCTAGALAALLQIPFDEAYGYVLASGRYVDPHAFKNQVKTEGMRAIISTVARVQAAVRGEATPEPAPEMTASVSSSVDEVALEDAVAAAPSEALLFAAGSTEELPAGPLAADTVVSPQPSDVRWPWWAVRSPGAACCKCSQSLT